LDAVITAVALASAGCGCSYKRRLFTRFQLGLLPQTLHTLTKRLSVIPSPFFKRLEMSYYHIPRPPVAYTVYVPQQCYTAEQRLVPQPPEVYYQPPPQEYIYHPPPEKRVYQPPPQTCVYQPPPQMYWYQPPAQTYEYQPPPQKYMSQPPAERVQDGDARMFRELGIPGRDSRWPTVF